jgi:hypothetical protein
MLRLVILLGIFILYFGFTSIENSYSMTIMEIQRISLIDDFCNIIPLCNTNSQTTPPQPLQQIESNLTNGTTNKTIIDSSGDYFTYNNGSLGLEIQYPVLLNKVENNRGVEFVFPNKNAGAILTTSEVKPTERSNYVMSHLLYLNKSLDNLFILNTSRSDVMGYPTATILFTYDNNTEPFKGMQFWKIKDGQARLFTYYAPADKVFDELLPIVDRMLKSIKVS